MKNRKGVSPVVAEVLLLGIAISAAVSGGVFIQDMVKGVQENAEDQINRDDKKSSSSININYGYNESSYLLIDVSNSGSYTIPVKEDGSKKWNLYAEGRPANWNFTSTGQSTQPDVSLDPSSTIRINTSSKFPKTGNSKEVEITGPLNIESSFVCFSMDGGCQS